MSTSHTRKQRKNNGYVATTINVTPSQKTFVFENNINLSRLIRVYLTNLMKEKMIASSSPNAEATKITQDSNSKEEVSTI